MKLIVAIIRPEKLNDVLEALFQADVRGITVSRVEGHGGEFEPVETYRGATVKMALRPDKAPNTVATFTTNSRRARMFAAARSGSP